MSICTRPMLCSWLSAHATSCSRIFCCCGGGRDLRSTWGHRRVGAGCRGVSAPLHQRGFKLRIKKPPTQETQQVRRTTAVHPPTSASVKSPRSVITNGGRSSLPSCTGRGRCKWTGAAGERLGLVRESALCAGVCPSVPLSHPTQLHPHCPASNETAPHLAEVHHGHKLGRDGQRVELALAVEILHAPARRGREPGGGMGGWAAGPGAVHNPGGARSIARNTQQARRRGAGLVVVGRIRSAAGNLPAPQPGPQRSPVELDAHGLLVHLVHRVPAAGGAHERQQQK